MSKSEQLIKDIAKGKNLTFEESKKIFLDIMSGNMGENLIFSFLVNLSIDNPIMHHHSSQSINC